MNNMIFDDVFYTMIKKMPYLTVPLINEVFHTSYPEDIKITQLYNERRQEEEKSITDFWLSIGKKMYHVECQSTDEATMMLRIVEHDFATAIVNTGKQGQRYQIKFPKSCVLLLRGSEKMSDHLEADVMFPDGLTHVYSIPIIKIADYTKDDLFEKNLLIFLPFYIIRYEKKGHELSENPQLFQMLLNEYKEIKENLGCELAEKRYTELIRLTELIIKIVDHVFQKEDEIRKRIDDVIEGRDLQLDPETFKAIEAVVYARSLARGRMKGEARLGNLINRLIQDQRKEEIQSAATDPEKREQLYKEYGI